MFHKGSYLTVKYDEPFDHSLSNCFVYFLFFFVCVLGKKGVLTRIFWE